MKEFIGFPEELQKLADLIAEQRRRLEADMNAGLAAKGGPNKDHIYAVKELAKAMSDLGKEMRQWSGHIKTNLDAMSPARKAQVVIQFIQSELPVGARRDLYEALARMEIARPDSVALQVAAAPAQVEA